MLSLPMIGPSATASHGIVDNATFADWNGIQWVESGLKLR